MALDGRELVLLLAKNPTGANETVRTVLLDPEPLHLLIALNDRTADGHDISWIWDVDYEPLLARAASLTLTGDRAYDLALRCATQASSPRAMTVLPDPESAPRPRPSRRPPWGHRSTSSPPTRPCSGFGDAGPAGRRGGLLA